MALSNSQDATAVTSINILEAGDVSSHSERSRGHGTHIVNPHRTSSYVVPSSEVSTTASLSSSATLYLYSPIPSSPSTSPTTLLQGSSSGTSSSLSAPEGSLSTFSSTPAVTTSNSNSSFIVPSTVTSVSLAFGASVSTVAPTTASPSAAAGGGKAGGASGAMMAIVVLGSILLSILAIGGAWMLWRWRSGRRKRTAPYSPQSVHDNEYPPPPYVLSRQKKGQVELENGKESLPEYGYTCYEPQIPDYHEPACEHDV